MLRQRDFEQVQRDTGFNIDLLEKVYHLTRILCGIENSKTLRRNLTLKGGSALNFLYLNMPRLSIDLDFNFTGTASKEKMQVLRPKILKTIKNLSEKLGYKYELRSQSYIMARGYIRYESIRGFKDRVKIEINFLDRMPVLGRINKKFSSSFPDIPAFSISTYRFEELIAMKIKAVMERMAVRDLYDLCEIRKQSFNINLARKLVVFYSCMTNKKLTKQMLMDKIRKYSQRDIIIGLNQFLRHREGTQNTVIAETENFLNKILELTNSEKLFLKRFWDERKIEPNLLFKDSKDKDKLKHHPSLLFRIKK
ncbi:MAG: nucleotidyl transferase AbiEii/AbiGii toxin family protein [Candidatus Thermoplasmatota archaeon]|nr:nucleotidyl transferase AbiEii/AbiGii toxin family protein [Candidatus Thermoplasmatota archaeon]